VSGGALRLRRRLAALRHVREPCADRTRHHLSPVCLRGEAVSARGPRRAHGYLELLEAIRDPRHERHEELLEWLGGTFAPEAFDPSGITFDDPKKRFKKAVGNR
jgi:hypothetical protein